MLCCFSHRCFLMKANLKGTCSRNALLYWTLNGSLKVQLLLKLETVNNTLFYLVNPCYSFPTLRVPTWHITFVIHQISCCKRENNTIGQIALIQRYVAIAIKLITNYCNTVFYLGYPCCATISMDAGLWSTWNRKAILYCI